MEKGISSKSGERETLVTVRTASISRVRQYGILFYREKYNARKNQSGQVS